MMPFAAFAQSIVVSGKVVSSDDGLGLPGVTIQVKGTTTGTVSDFDGNYTLSADATDVLIFSYVGSATIDVSDLPSGMYFVHIVGGKVVTRKVVIEN